MLIKRFNAKSSIKTSLSMQLSAPGLRHPIDEHSARWVRRTCRTGLHQLLRGRGLHRDGHIKTIYQGSG
jgi:hypothetical protein